jgi:GTP-binding protein HflX
VTQHPTTLIDRSFREKIVLVGMVFPDSSPEQLDRDLEELALLVDTAGADVMATVIQRRDRPDPATFLGSGKVEELHQICLAVDADTVVFDHNLSPAQQRNLEKALGRTAIDRTAVILDIFAQNARSPEGKAQVELALLRYRLPRLRRSGASLAQQSGVIGTRGPGETQLEVDRRRLVNRMLKLERNLEEIERTRDIQRASRQRGRHREVTLVGYTNAGKSSLLNRLTHADVPAEDRLFVTLDPRTRQYAMPGGETVLFTDTVGFISKLPHELVRAFKSTLDSVRFADLLVHVVDASSELAEAQIEAVQTVLDDIGAGEVPQLLVFNKADKNPEAALALSERFEGSLFISAATGLGCEQLISTVGDRLRERDRAVTLRIPAARGDLLAQVHREGDVLGKEVDGTDVVVRVVLDEAAQALFDQWRNPS